MIMLKKEVNVKKILNFFVFGFLVFDSFDGFCRGRISFSQPSHFRFFFFKFEVEVRKLKTDPPNNLKLYTGYFFLTAIVFLLLK